MNRDEYNKLFHKVGLNRVAFKMVNDCDGEILALVNAAIEAEREECAKVCEALGDASTVGYAGEGCKRAAAAIRARGRHEKEKHYE